MSEIKVGEYVRTKRALIAKVCAYQDLTTYDDKGISVTFHSFDTDKGSIADVEVKNHKEKLIELVEVGDYVNGHKVINFLYTNDKEIPTVIKCSNENFYMEKDIKSIVTKEQFKNIEYKVGE